MYELTEMVIRRGYQNIGLLCANQEQWIFQQHLQGWYKAMLRHHLSPNRVINAAMPPSFSTGAAQLPEFLLAWPELDALVCVSDELACGALYECQRRRIKVPDDLAVVGFEGVGLVFTGSLILGLIMAFFPAIAQRYMKRITGNDEIAFGHFGTLGYVLSGWIGSRVGKGSRSTEEMNLPKNLSFLRDSSISISLTMMIIYLIMAVSAGREYVEATFSGGQNYLVYAIIMAITFAAGVFIILQGVRLILAEIVPAFTGFSEKLVPNARPALDCPVVYPYAPNAVLIGFLFSFLGGIVGLLICGQFSWVLIQLDGELDEIICAFDLEGKFRAFGFDVVTVKGDDIPALLKVTSRVPEADARPRVVILDSIKGQGVPYLEQLSNSHHLRLTAESKAALNETIRQLEASHD